MTEKEFWMVWRLHGNAPTFRHTTENDARREAVRLARNVPGSKFYLLHAVESFTVPSPDVITEKLEDDEVPF